MQVPEEDILCILLSVLTHPCTLHVSITGVSMVISMATFHSRKHSYLLSQFLWPHTQLKHFGRKKNLFSKLARRIYVRLNLVCPARP